MKNAVVSAALLPGVLLNPLFTRKVWSELVIAAFLWGTAPVLAIDNYAVLYTNNATGGVDIYEHATGQLRTVWSKPGNQGANDSRLSPDGESVAIQVGTSLVIVDINGENIRTYNPSNWPTNTSQYGQKWAYTLNGVFWPMDNGNLYRFDPATGKSTVLSRSGGSIPGALYMSGDGRKGYASRQTFLKVSADFSSVQAKNTDSKGCLSGHGDCITGLGGYVAWNGFSNPCRNHNLGSVPFTDALFNSIPQSGCNYPGMKCTDVRGYNWDGVPNPPVPQNAIANWGGPRQVINSDVWVMVRVGEWRTSLGHVQRHLFVNLETDEFVLVPQIQGEAIYNGLRYEQGWIGPLPNPQDGAYITIDTEALSFTGQAPEGQSVTIKVSGTKPAGTISALVTPALATWLTCTVENSSSAQATITNTIKSEGIADGVHTATVVVSGTSADNSPSYTVIWYKGSAAVMPPTDLSADVQGENLQDVILTWKTPSLLPQGYAIERRTETDPAWKEIFRSPAEATSHIDGNVPLDYYSYRLRSFSGSASDLSPSTYRYSDYTPEVRIRVEGAAGITVTAPGANDTLKAGSTYNIRWKANQTANVVISYSTNEGDTWAMINTLGGVVREDSTWEDYPWVVPNQNLSNVIIMVADYVDQDLYGHSAPFHISDAVSESRANVRQVSSRNAQRLFVERRAENAFIIARSTGAHSVAIYDARGALVVRFRGEGYARYQLPVAKQSGMYLLHMEAGAEQVRSCFVLP